MAIATFPVLLGTGIHASRPAAAAVGKGGVYSCTTHGLIYQSDGSSWTTWATLGGPTATRASLGLDTTDSPQFAGLNVGHASDTTVTRTGAGDIAVEGNGLYRAGGTDVPVADGGTGASTASVARTNLGLALGTDIDARVMTTQDDIIFGGAAGAATRLAKGSDGQVLTVDPTTHHLLWATPSSGFANPMTTKGDLIVGDTGGSPIRKAVGSDGQVMTADAASTGGVKWAAAAGGSSGRVLLATLVAASSASLDFATRNAAGQSGAIFQSDFTVYEIEIVSLVMATNAVNLWLRMGTGGGPTYDTGNNYSYDHFVWRAGGTGVGGGTAQAKIIVDFSATGDSINNGTAALAGVQGLMRLFDPQNTTLYKQVRGWVSYLDASPFRVTNEVRGAYESATAVTALRFMASSGNITSGTISISGVA